MTEKSKASPTFPAPPQIPGALAGSSASLNAPSAQEVPKQSVGRSDASGPVTAQRSTPQKRWGIVIATGLLGLVVGVIVTTIVRKPLVDETRFINFDPTSRPLLGAGFSEPEGSGDDAFAWCSAKTCKVTIYSRGDVDRTIAFQAAPYSFPNAPEQTVKVLLNGSPLGTSKFGGGVSVTRVKAPKTAWKPGPNELRFDFAYAEAPKDHVPGNGDARRLAAAFVWIAVTGPAAPAASASGTR